MPSGFEKLEGNRFIIRYELPWGGIATNAQPEDIAPNQMQSTQGIFIRDGVLASTNFDSFNPTLYKHSFDGTNPYLEGTTGFEAIYTAGDNLAGIDQNVRGYLYDFSAMKWNIDQVQSDEAINPSYTCSIMIEGKIYIFDYINATLWVYTPRVSMVQALQVDGSPQNFVAGKYCMTVDQYLITANTYMPSDTPQYHPSGYSWSGPSKYTTFDPNTDDTLNEGWNQLAEVQKEITGCFAMSNVGYILHDQGLTQLTPTALTGGGNNAGLMPFDATALWTSKDGVGCTMPDTLSVYGYFAMWGNNNDFYLFSAGAAPEPICGVARKAIFEDINMFKYSDNRYFNIHGNIINCGVSNKNPVLVYNLYIVYQTPITTGNMYMIVWSFVFESKTWTRTLIDITAAANRIITIPFPSFSLVNDKSSTFRFPSSGALEGISYWFQSSLYGGALLNLIQAGSGIGYGLFLFQYINEEGDVTITDTPPTTNIIFRSEEFQLDRTPTIRGIILRAAGTGTLNISINGTPFSPISVNSPNKTKRYPSYGMVTDVDNAATLRIQSTDFNGFISKVHAFGTYAEGEPI